MPADAGRNNVYNVTVVATDDATGVGGKMTATRAVTIMVTNVEEDGTVTLSAQQPYVGVALTASVTDLDGPTTDVTWKWERVTAEAEANASAVAVAAGVIIEGATSATYTPVSDDEDKYLRAIATYTDPQGKGKTSVKASVAQAQKRTDNAPKFAAESVKRMIAENAAAVSNVFIGEDDSDTQSSETDDPVRATDADGGLLTYSLSGRDASSFTIMSDTTADALGGQIETKAKLDYEAKSTYMVTVTATDPDNLSGSIDVTINVTDVNEAPEVTAGDAEKDYPENQTRAVASYRATDPERGTIYWSLLPANTGSLQDLDATLTADDDADESYFTINADGVLSFNVSPDYEMPRGMANAPGNTNTYKVVVVASDDAPGAVVIGNQDACNKGYKKVVVTVTDVDEPGMVTLSSLQPQIDVGADSRPSPTPKFRTSPPAMLPGSGRSPGAELRVGTALAAGIRVQPYAHRTIPPRATTCGRRRPIRTPMIVTRGPRRQCRSTRCGRCTYFPRTKPAATFPDDADERSIAENSPAGTNVGDPVKATDTVLTTF